MQGTGNEKSQKKTMKMKQILVRPLPSSSIKKYQTKQKSCLRDTFTESQNS